MMLPESKTMSDKQESSDSSNNSEDELELESGDVSQEELEDSGIHLQTTERSLVKQTHDLQRKLHKEDVLLKARQRLRLAVDNMEKQGRRTKAMLQSAMEKVERRGRHTRERLTSEWQLAIKGVEKKKQRTKEILTKAKTEIMYAIEEKEQQSLKHGHLQSGRVIPAAAVPRFRDPYVYNASCGSVLELLFFQRFWIWLSRHVPLCIMPCTITFTGLAINVITTYVLLHYSPNATSEIPAWALYLCAAGLFIYQTLDALDGKQCTKLQETHLEEFGDHGADSVSTTFVTLAVCLGMQLGEHPTLMYIFVIASLFAFYSTHWQSHVTDVVVFGKIDVTEAQVAMMASHLISGWFGQSVWKFQVEPFGLELRVLVVSAVIASEFLAVLGNLRIIAGGRTPLDGLADIPRRKGVRVLYPLILVGGWMSLSLIQFLFSGVFVVSPVLFCLMCGFCFSKLVLKLQVSSLGKIDCDFADVILVAPLLLCVNAWLELVPDHTALMSALVYTLMEFLRYATYLSWDVCDFQDVYIFTLKHPIGHPKNKAGSRGIYCNGLNNEAVKAIASAKKERT